MQINTKTRTVQTEVEVTLYDVTLTEAECELVLRLLGMAKGREAHVLHKRLCTVRELRPYNVTVGLKDTKQSVPPLAVTLDVGDLGDYPTVSQSELPVKARKVHIRREVVQPVRTATLELSDREAIVLRALLGRQKADETGRLYNALGRHPVMEEAKEALGVSFVSDIGPKVRTNQPDAVTFNHEVLAKFSNKV